jgi:hypothetical protein
MLLVRCKQGRTTVRAYMYVYRERERKRAKERERERGRFTTPVVYNAIANSLELAEVEEELAEVEPIA